MISQMNPLLGPIGVLAFTTRRKGDTCGNRGACVGMPRGCAITTARSSRKPAKEGRAVGRWMRAPRGWLRGKRRAGCADSYGLANYIRANRPHAVTASDWRQKKGAQSARMRAQCHEEKNKLRLSRRFSKLHRVPPAAAVTAPLHWGRPAISLVDTCGARVSLWHFTADHGASLGRASVPARGTSARDRLVSASQRVRDADRRADIYRDRHPRAGCTAWACVAAGIIGLTPCTASRQTKLS